MPTTETAQTAHQADTHSCRTLAAVASDWRANPGDPGLIAALANWRRGFETRRSELGPRAFVALILETLDGPDLSGCLR